MVDIHCHILPGVDDGADCLDTSVALARQAVAQGVTVIAATSHYRWSDNPLMTGDKVLGLVADVNSALKKAGVKLTVVAGCEVPISEPDVLAIIADTGLTYGAHSKAVLLEPSFKTFAANGIDTVKQSMQMHLLPVIAHPERCAALRDSETTINRLVDLGAILQVTASSLYKGDPSDPTRVAANRLLSDGLVGVIASDAHNPERRSIQMKQAYKYISDKSGSHIAELLCNTIPMAIASGEEVIHSDIYDAYASKKRSGFRGLMDRLLKR
ncbi:MAG: tyrosine-protein phosphatase [Armatimonadota bacterium]